MPLSARQQTRLNYLQKRRPNDPEVAKLQNKGVAGSLPVGRGAPPIEVPQSSQPAPQMQQMQPSGQTQFQGAAEGADPGRYPSQGTVGGFSQSQAQIQPGANPNFSRPEDFVKPGTRLGQAFAEGALKEGLKYAVKPGERVGVSGFKNNPYQVLRK